MVLVDRRFLGKAEPPVVCPRFPLNPAGPLGQQASLFVNKIFSSPTCRVRRHQRGPGPDRKLQGGVDGLRPGAQTSQSGVSPPPRHQPLNLNRPSHALLLVPLARFARAESRQSVSQRWLAHTHTHTNRYKSFIILQLTTFSFFSFC